MVDYTVQSLASISVRENPEWAVLGAGLVKGIFETETVTK